MNPFSVQIRAIIRFSFLFLIYARLYQKQYIHAIAHFIWPKDGKHTEPRAHKETEEEEEEKEETRVKNIVLSTDSYYCSLPPTHSRLN